MELIKTIDQMRSWTESQRQAGKTIGFVPTMGYLHEAHLSLVEKARAQNDTVVMSIFVNPMQFGPQEDFATYPRDLDRDCRLAEGAGVDVIFHPEPGEIYPQYPPLTAVEVKGITECLCGKSRPGHFTGVATVVLKLFNIVQPHRAYFGQKDYQQLLVIRQMVADLNLPVIIEPVPIKREEDGLAMSSRNAYLSPAERQEALALSQALQMCKNMYSNGELRVSLLIEAMKARILQEPSAVIDYIEIRHATTLAPLTEITGPAVVALAVRIGKTRLIDNLLLEGN
ncbi:MAG: pantoate--beta-alanine ligase [Clostridia bacterium]|nr:pantoate--beta-alanine ligase [Clostridia bacterium]